jgi:hypothetical protein
MLRLSGGILRLSPIAAALFLGAQPAPAATLALDFGLSGPALSAPGLVIDVEPVAASVDLDIAARQTVTFDLFAIWTDERRIDDDDLTARSLRLSVALPAFAAVGGIGGEVVGHSVFFDIFQWGTVTWDEPLTLTFGRGGILSVAVSNALFNFGFDGLSPGIGNGATVRASVTYVREPAGVPLPASGLLLIAGCGMLGFVRRRAIPR